MCQVKLIPAAYIMACKRLIGLVQVLRADVQPGAQDGGEAIGLLASSGRGCSMQTHVNTALLQLSYAHSLGALLLPVV